MLNGGYENIRVPGHPNLPGFRVYILADPKPRGFQVKSESDTDFADRVWSSGAHLSTHPP